MRSGGRSLGGVEVSLEGRVEIPVDEDRRRAPSKLMFEEMSSKMEIKFKKHFDFFKIKFQIFCTIKNGLSFPVIFTKAFRLSCA